MTTKTQKMDNEASEESAFEDRDGLGDLSRKESDELCKRLQENYDELLTKYAQAENTIDQLRIGAKLNLYSDLPPPQQSTFVSVPRERQPQAFTFPRSNRASFDRVVSQNGDTERSSDRAVVQSHGKDGLGNPYTFRNIATGVLTPGAQADNIKAGLMSQLPHFQDDVDTLQTCILEGQPNETELRKIQGLCDELKGQHAQMMEDLAEAQRLASGEDDSLLEQDGLNAEFLPEDSLEGQLYRLGLRLNEISEQISDSLLHNSPLNMDYQEVRKSYNDVLNRPRTDSHNLPGEKKIDPELKNLMKRLKNIKEANKDGDIHSRIGNSLEDVRDGDLNAERDDGDYRRRFSSGSLQNDSPEKKSPLERLPSVADLGESGYFASETMSVNNDPEAAPLSSLYLTNSRTQSHQDSPTGAYNDHSPEMYPRERTWSGSLVESRQRRPSRQTSRSRANTRDASAPPDGGDSAPSSPDYPSPDVSPRDSSKTPIGSTSPVRSFSHDYPTPRRQGSRLSEASLRSQAGSNMSRIPRPSVTDSLDVTQDPRHSMSRIPRPSVTDFHDVTQDRSRDRSFSSQSTPRSVQAEDVFDPNPRVFSKISPPKPANQRRSVSGESRVSTPLFQPHQGGARSKELNARGGRPATAETERGFDSGFIGSEGSRISRGNESPDIPHSFLRESKSHGRVPLRENSVSESEDGQYSVASSKVPKPGPRYKDPRRRRSYLQSLSESEKDRSMGTDPPKTSLRTPSSQRERRTHRHTPTHPAVRSDAEGARRLDDSLRRYSSSPNLNDAATERTTPRHESGKPRSSDAADNSQRRGPRSEQSGRPTDGRSYPGMDRESLRSRRTRRDGDDTSSGYSEEGRKHRRDPTESLRAELQRLRTRLEDEASARTAQGHLYDDLRRRHDDLEREMARRNTEQQLSSMYDNLRKKYDDLAGELGRRGREPPEASPSPQMYEDLRSRLENLAREVDTVRKRDDERPSGAPATPSGTVRFLCPFCGGYGVHSHGEYFYPGFADLGTSSARPESPHVTPRNLHTSATQTAHTLGTSGVHTRHQTTPVSTSAPLHYGVSSPWHHHHHHHTQTYPGSSGSPTVHHIHHLPGNARAPHHADADSEVSSSEEETPRLRRHPVRRHHVDSRRSRGSHHEDELAGSHRLHLSLDEANRAARQMQKLSKRMLSSITTDILRSTKSR